MMINLYPTIYLVHLYIGKNENNKSERKNSRKLNLLRQRKIKGRLLICSLYSLNDYENEIEKFAEIRNC